MKLYEKTYNLKDERKGCAVLGSLNRYPQFCLPIYLGDLGFLLPLAGGQERPGINFRCLNGPNRTTFRQH